MSVQSRRAGRCCGGGHCRLRCPARKERNICSKSVGTGGLTTAVGQSRFPLPVAVATSPKQAPPASEPEAPAGTRGC